MKKILSLIIIFLFSIISSSVTFCVFADDTIEDKELNKILSDIQSEAEKAIDDDVSDILESENISVEDPESVTNLNPENIFKKIFGYFSEAVKSPLLMLGKIIGISIICVIVKSISPENGAAAKVFKLTGVLACITLMTQTVSGSFIKMQQSMEDINRFMIAYIPVFSGVTASGGHMVSSGSYTAVMLCLCESLAVISSKILIPFLSVVTAITLISAINPNMQLSNFADSVKKCVIWLLSGTMSIFVGIMSVQGITAGSVDNAASKTVKFAASSFIPIIGSSVSQAYSAVKGSVGVIRNTAGSLGIIIVFIMAVKPIIFVLAIKFTIWAGKIINDIFGQKELSGFLNSINSVMTIGLSILIAYSMAFIIATSMVMITAVNGG